MQLVKYKEYYSVLTNGVTEFEFFANRYGCGVDPGTHIVGQDGFGNTYIDGVKAHVEVRERKYCDA